MAETISAYEMAHRSLLMELEETRSRLVKIQYQMVGVRVDPYIRMKMVPKKVPSAWPRSTLQEEAPPSLCYVHLVGVWAKMGPTFNPITMGLHLRRFDIVITTREALLGAPEPFYP